MHGQAPPVLLRLRRTLRDGGRGRPGGWPRRLLPYRRRAGCLEEGRRGAGALTGRAAELCAPPAAPRFPHVDKRPAAGADITKPNPVATAARKTHPDFRDLRSAAGLLAGITAGNAHVKKAAGEYDDIADHRFVDRSRGR